MVGNFEKRTHLGARFSSLKKYRQTSFPNMLKFALVAACAVQLAVAADPKIASTADGTLTAEDKFGKVMARFCSVV